MGDSRESLVFQYRMSMIRQPDYMAIEKMRANQESEREPEKGELTDDVLEAIEDWSVTGFEDVRNGDNPDEEWVLENFVQGHTYEKKIFRGVGTYKEYKDWQKGALVDQKGLSSWSTEESVAKEFADMNGPNKFVFVMGKGTKKGADIHEYSDMPYEKEILVSGTSQQRITKRVKKGKFVYLYCEEV